MAESAEDRRKRKNRERQQVYRDRVKREREEIEKATGGKEDIPKASKGAALRTIGYPGRRSRTAFLTIDDPILAELRGTRAARTFDRMLLDPVIAGAVDRMSLMLRSAEWSMEPGTEVDETTGLDVVSDESKHFSDRVQENIDHLYPGWQATVADSAEVVVWGFHVAEVLFHRPADDGYIGWESFLPIEQRTVQEWKVSVDTGRLEGVYQLPEDAPGRWLPDWKILHFRSKPAAGRPEGKSYARNSFLPWTDKQELRRIMKQGIRRDWTGLADYQVPEKLLSTNATAEEKALLEEIETMVREVERDEREGIVRPSETEAGTDKPTGYKFGVVQSPGTRQIQLKDIWETYNNEIALGLFIEVVLQGTSGRTGNYSQAKEKMVWVARAMGSLLDGVAEFMNQVALPQLRRFNPMFEGVPLPKFKHGAIDKIELEAMADYFDKLGKSGFVQPDEETERFLRRQVGAPESASEEEL